MVESCGGRFALERDVELTPIWMPLSTTRFADAPRRLRGLAVGIVDELTVVPAANGLTSDQRGLEPRARLVGALQFCESRQVRTP